MNSNPDFHHNPIVTGNLRLFENCHYGAFDRSVFCITNSPPLVAPARTRIYRKNHSVRAAGVTILGCQRETVLQSQRITLAHRLKVAWAHDENFYFAQSQSHWGQSCCPTIPRLRERRKRSWRRVGLNDAACQRLVPRTSIIFLRSTTLWTTAVLAGASLLGYHLYI
jgi:hypothetical protein